MAFVLATVNRPRVGACGTECRLDSLPHNVLTMRSRKFGVAALSRFDPWDDNMYAMVEILGKQYKAEPGAVLKVDHMADKNEGDDVSFDSVLMLNNDGKVSVGKPYVGGAAVEAVVEGHGRDAKITVFKFKRRKNYARRLGHRAYYSLVRVKEIAAK